MGSSLFTLFFARNWNFGFATVVIAHILFCVSFVALTVQARVRGLRLDARGRRARPGLDAPGAPSARSPSR